MQNAENWLNFGQKYLFITFLFLSLFIFYALKYFIYFSIKYLINRIKMLFFLSKYRWTTTKFCRIKNVSLYFNRFYAVFGRQFCSHVNLNRKIFKTLFFKNLLIFQLFFMIIYSVKHFNNITSYKNEKKNRISLYILI